MPALLHALEKATAPGARPSPAASTRQPILHPFQSHKPCARTFTGWGRARMPALLHALEKATAPGARPSPAASTRQPTLRPVSITQTRRPHIHQNLKSVPIPNLSCIHRNSGLRNSGLARAFSPYPSDTGPTTWGVAPGWYRSGLRPYNHRHTSDVPEQICCEVQ